MHDVAVELFHDGAWHDVVPDAHVLAGQPITITRGDGEESAAPRPQSLTLRLDNTDDQYRTSNPQSPLYGRAGRNTPVRVSVGGSVRGVVEAGSWRTGQSQDFRRHPKRGTAWTDVRGGGLLQRVNQWSEPLKSPFRQFNETMLAGRATAVGYFPCEQPRGSTGLASTVPGTHQQGTFSGVQFDSQTRPAGSAPLIDISEGAGVGYYFAGTPLVGSTAGWQLSWVGRYEPLAAGEQTIMYWSTADGTAYGLYLDGSTGELLIYSSLAGVPVLANGVTFSGWDWTQWTLFSIDAQYSAGTTTVWINWRNADNTEGGFFNPSFTGVPSSLTWWSVLGGPGEIPDGSTMGHVMGVNERSSFGIDLFAGARRAAWAGYAGETTADRFVRLCEQQGIDCSVQGDPAAAWPMGPQQPATFAEQLREIRDTEDGLIFDAAADLELIMVTRGARYNRTPALALQATDLRNLPDEVTDDLPVHNVVTAEDVLGGEYTAVDDTGPLGTPPPPDGAGEYRQTVNVSVADPPGDLPAQAHWWLRRGTVDLPRYPQVVINLAAVDATLRAQAEAVDIGDVITIDGFREDQVRLHVIGLREVIGWPTARTLTLTCAPDQQFQVGIYDASRYDVRTCTTADDTGPTVTTLELAIVDDEAWSSTSAYDVMIAGELIGVPAGAMGARAGTAGAYTQTVTGAVRSKNGIRKTLPAGSPVRVASPGRYAL